MKRRLFLTGAVSLGITPLNAAPGAAATAIAGDRFSSDGVEYHLADVKAPSLYALERAHEPYFEQAREAFAGLLGGALPEWRAVAPPTRWGGQLIRANRAGDDLTLQEHLVQAGAARVWPQTDDISFIDKLLSLEKIARTARRGLWAFDVYQVVDAENAERAIGAFHLVEGIVAHAAKAGGRFYLNFADDYRTDFTATAASSVYRRWLKQDFDLAMLADKPVRVRGFVDEINGPSLDLTHLRQIELLG